MATTCHGRNFATGAEESQCGPCRSVLGPSRRRNRTSLDRMRRNDSPGGFLSHPSSFCIHGLRLFPGARHLTTLVATQFARNRPKGL